MSFGLQIIGYFATYETMRISDAERYGMRVMFYLAIEGAKERVPKTLNEIAKDRNISRNYIANIMPKFRKAGLVESIKGKYGGYVLAKPPEQISYLDILNALEHKMGLFECISNPSSCRHSANCPRRDFWEIMCNGIARQLSKYTLKDSMKHYSEYGMAEVPFCDLDNKRTKNILPQCKAMKNEGASAKSKRPKKQ